MGDVKTNRWCLEAAGCFTGIHFQAISLRHFIEYIQHFQAVASHLIHLIVFLFRCRGAQVAPVQGKVWVLTNSLPESKFNLVLIIISHYKGEQ